MDFDFNTISISIIPFGFEPKNQIQEKGKAIKFECQFNENGKI